MRERSTGAGATLRTVVVEIEMGLAHPPMSTYPPPHPPLEAIC